LANPGQYKSANSTSGSELVNDGEFDDRTSLIVDPPDGRIPPYTPEGQRRQRALVAATLMQNPPSGPEELPSQGLTLDIPLG
jgi:hypothetical protein